MSLNETKWETLKQNANVFSFFVTTYRDRQRVEEAAAEIDLSATRLLPGLVPGEALFMGVDFPVPVSVRVSQPASPPESAGPRFSTGWVPTPTSPDQP